LTELTFNVPLDTKQVTLKTFFLASQKGKINVDFNEARDDGVAVASAGPHANHLHLAPER